MSDNNNNNNKERTSLINTLMHYIMQNKLSSSRQSLCTRINPEIKEEFYFTCRKLGLLVSGRFNVALEALMQNFNDSFKDTPSMIQTHLLSQSKHEKRKISLPLRLELKIVRRDLFNVVEGLETKRAHKDFLEAKLREVLPKAIRVYQDTNDKEIGDLLKEAEKFV